MNCARSTPPCAWSSACDDGIARGLEACPPDVGDHDHHPRHPQFRDRVLGPAPAPGDVSTTVLRSWYATVLRWRRPVALFVNERMLLPLVMPLAPARTLLTRFPDALAELLSAHQVPAPLIESEHAEAREHQLAPTANRSLVGS